MQVTTLGIDLAKQVFHVYGADAQGREVFRNRLARSASKPVLATTALRRWDGSVWRCALLGAGSRAVRA